jgi:hypothetical protein
MERSGVDLAFRGLWLDSSGPSLPATRVEVVPPRQLRIVQADRTVLLGWVDPNHWGVEYLRTDTYRSCLDPISADVARRRARDVDDEEAWWAGWCHAFADGLDASECAPMHAGSWTLRPARVATETASLAPMRHERRPTVDAAGLEHDERLLGPEGSGFIDWRWSGSNAVLPLRSLSSSDAGRVKALRKLVTERTLPPVLVWWIGGLACSVIVDGHDRFAAALAEGVAPPLIELTSVRPPDDGRVIDGDLTSTLEELVRLADEGEGSSPRARAVGVQLAQAQLRAEERARTRAWPLPGGREAWVREATQLSPSWVEHLRATVEGLPASLPLLEP